MGRNRRSPRHCLAISPRIVLAPALGLVLAALPALPAAAAVPKGASPRGHEEKTALPADLGARLESGDEARVRSALDDVRAAGGGGAVAIPMVVEALRKGLPGPLAVAALDALADTSTAGSPPAVGGASTVAWYVRHRSPTVRRSAAHALGHFGGPASVKALRLALTDSDTETRAIAATALGELGTHDATADLVLALSHDVTTAPWALGRTCSGKECEAITTRLGALPFELVSAGVEQALLRPSTQVDDGTKVALIGKVRALATPEATGFLRAVQKKWPPKLSPRAKIELDQAASALTEGKP